MEKDLIEIAKLMRAMQPGETFALGVRTDKDGRWRVEVSGYIAAEESDWCDSPSAAVSHVKAKLIGVTEKLLDERRADAAKLTRHTEKIAAQLRETSR